MRVFDWYVFRNLALATVFITLTLTAVVFLTQSLRFLDLVMDSGASAGSFWLLTFLALPRFLEMIVPLSLMAATIFIYNRMTLDSELVVTRAVGFSPSVLARPAIVLALVVTLLLLSLTMWFTPRALANLEHTRQIIRTQVSMLLFREGVFNRIGNGFTVYIRERASDSELRGIMIHDSRPENKNPSTILAKRGVIVSGDSGNQVLVYDGSRQEYDAESHAVHRLNFDRYTIDLPEGAPMAQRWQEPNERTFFELLRPNMNNPDDVRYLREFYIEAHRRITTPLLAMTLCALACAVLLVGPVDRRGQGRRVAFIILAAVILQSLFLTVTNIARQSLWGVPLMYGLVLLPLGLSLAVLMDLPLWPGARKHAKAVAS